MLLKLLKYDMKAIWKVALVVSLVSVGAAFAGGVGWRVFTEGINNENSSPFIIIPMFAFMLSIFAVIASSVIISIFVYVRFYKNLYTDEGYLTFTLPVSRRQILLSKTLNSLIWTVYQVIILIVSLSVYSLLIPRDETTNITIGDMLESFGSLFEAMSAWDVLSVIFAVLTVIVYAIFGVCLVHLCISLGAMMVKKGKLIVGIVLYILISGVVESLVQVGIILASLIYEALFGYGTALSESIASDIFTTGMFFVALVLSVGVLFLTYFLTQKIIDRKLNLA